MKKISFPNRSEFFGELKKRVKEFLEKNILPARDDWRMYLKNFFILSILAAAYGALVFHAESLLSALALSLFVAQSIVLVGFNVQHDANHGALSRHRWVNTLFGYSLNLIGGYRWIWHEQHNILHHTYTNIAGADNDINLGALARLSPKQEWKPWHRWQHIYTFFLYGFTTLSWICFSDFQRFFTGKIGEYDLPKKTPEDYRTFFLSKGLYFCFALVLPSFLHPFWMVVLFFICIHLITGFTLSIIFQLAHTVEGAHFDEPNEQGEIDNAWAIHQVLTTRDFATGNKFLAWYLGGLNFQVVHHLFHVMCHMRYPDIVGIVRDTCLEFDIEYKSFPTIRAAIAAHYRHLKNLSRKPAPLKLA